jgi:hypothetical protein
MVMAVMCGATFVMMRAGGEPAGRREAKNVI